VVINEEVGRSTGRDAGRVLAGIGELRLFLSSSITQQESTVTQTRQVEWGQQYGPRVLVRLVDNRGPYLLLRSRVDLRDV